jgi:hypothetical protein
MRGRERERERERLAIFTSFQELCKISQLIIRVEIVVWRIVERVNCCWYSKNLKP